MQERVLHGVRAEGLAEAHQPRPAVLRQGQQRPFECVQQRPVLLAAHRDPVEGQEGRAQRVLERDRRAVAPGQVFECFDRDVVDVTAAGGRGHTQHRPLERTQPGQVLHHQVDAYVHGLPGRQPGERAHGRLHLGNRCPGHVSDLLPGQSQVDEPDALS